MALPPTPPTGQTPAVQIPTSVLTAGPNEAEKKAFEEQMLMTYMNSNNLFFQQLPGNVSGSNLLGELQQKMLAPKPEDDPAAADLDTGNA